MRFKINVELDPEWVLSHRDDPVLPVATLINEFDKHFRCIIDDSGPSELLFTVESDRGFEFVRNRIYEIFSSIYGAPAPSVMRVSLAENTPSFEMGGATTSTSSGERNAEESGATSADFLDRLCRRTAGGDTATNGRPTSGNAAARPKGGDATNNILAEIQSLVGAEEFVELAKELVKIAPEIKERGLERLVLSRCYLFAISDGCGFSTAASLLAKLYGALGFACYESVNEIILPPFTDNMDKLRPVFAAIESPSSDVYRTVISLDISEWMNKTTNVNFRAILKAIEANKDHLVVLFRIPYVEKELVSGISRTLNDMMTTKLVSFPPATREQILDFAKKELGDKGFTVQSAALEQIWNRLNEEKSDGRFYGIKTVKKVLDELVYDKIANSHGKCGSVISGKDASDLLKMENPDKRTAQQMLDALIGNETLKDQLNAIVAQIKLAKLSEEETPCIHMRFVGNPGTGKTTVARIVGKMLKEEGILRIGGFFEVSGRDFCGRYIGETAPKTASICRDAYGSVLFIDEAYSLYRSSDEDSRDFGREALDTLIAEMENHRDDFVVIMAGYTDEMDKLMQGNRGLKSRMPYTIEFPNFTREQLFEIFRSLLATHKYEEQLVDVAKKYFDELPEDLITSKEFSNGRFVRNLYERTWAKAALRCQLAGLKTVTLSCKDFELASADKDFALDGGKKKARLGFY